MTGWQTIGYKKIIQGFHQEIMSFQAEYYICIETKLIPMKKLYTVRFFSVLLCLLLTSISFAQTIGWNFTSGDAPNTTTANLQASVLTQGNNQGVTTMITSSSAATTSAYTGASGGNNAGAAARVGALNTAAGGSAYFEFTLTPAAGYQFAISSISFGARSTSTGPQSYSIRTSNDGYASNLATGTIANTGTWALKSNSGLSFSSSNTITIRIYGHDGTGSASNNTANWRIDDLQLAVAVSMPTNIASLSDLSLSTGIFTPGFQSATYSYTSSVPANVSSLTVTPVSTAANASITVNGQAVSSNTASQSIALNTGSNTISIVVTSQDATVTNTYTIQVTREAAGLPAILISNASLDFANQCINTIGNGSFSISGTNLDGSPVSLVAPSGYSLSLQANTNFSSSINISYSGTSLATTTVYVRFSPVLVQAYNSAISINSTTNVPVTGNGVNTPASISTVSSTNISFATASLSASLNSSGCSPISAYGFEYSTTNNFTAGTGSPVSAGFNAGQFSATITGLQANTTYYVRAFATNNDSTVYGSLASFTTTAKPVVMAAQPALNYQQNFDNISSWTNGFVSNNGADNFSPVASAGTSAIPSPNRITTASNTFSTGSSGGVQRGTGAIVLLATGGTDNSSSTAFDLLLDFTGVTAGTIGFNWASVNNSTGNRAGSLRVYGSVDGTTFTELTGAAVLNIINNEPTSGTVTNIALPAIFSNNANARLRFYYYNGTGGTTGSRPKISIDNLTIKGYDANDQVPPQVNSLSPANGATAVIPAGGLQIVFSELVVPATGNITLQNLTNGTQQVIPINDPAVSIVGNTLSVQVGLQSYKSYAVSIDNGALNDLGGNAFAGINAANWSFTTGAPPTSFNFNDCTNNLPGGFTQYSVSGAQVWGCTTFGQTGNGVQINGFAGSAQNNEDWLISPGFDLSGFNYPILRFSSRVRFAGPALQLMVSTNYSGSGDPHAATWTVINGRFADPDSDVWTLSDQIDLSNFKDSNVHVAFVYQSSTTDGAARWTLDDLAITNSATPALAGVDIRGAAMDFDYVASGQNSPARSFTAQGYNLTGDVLITAPAGFEISRDQTSYSTYFIIPMLEAMNKNTIYVRFKPTTNNQPYSGQVIAQVMNSEGNYGIQVSGTSLRTLKVVNWNLEWFGSTASGLGPTNKDLQQQNVQQVLNTLKADVYALVEIVDTLRFKNVAAALPGNYGYVVNDYGSYADDVNDPDYAGAQKMGFIYNKDVVTKLTSRGMLRTSTGNAFNSWASGRYPYLMQAEINLNGATSTVDFIVIHAKANTGNTADKIESYQRRKAGADELKDSLDAAFGDRKIIILGDFNDDFDKTITTEMAPVTVSSYSTMLADSANYVPVTLSLSLTGNSSTASFPDMIDHVIISNELKKAYVNGSARVYRDVLSLVGNFANTTSDHFPIITQYDWRYFAAPDVQPIDIGALADSGKCYATLTLSPPIVNSLNQIVSVSSNAPATFPVGVTTVTWTVTDNQGNTATKNQLITVSDNQAPEVYAPDIVSVVNDPGTCGAVIASLGTPYVNDNCGIASISNDAPAVFPIGTTIVTWLVADIHGNVTDTAKQYVIVIDNDAPVATVQHITVPAAAGQCSATVQVAPPAASDNCGIASMNGVRADGQPLTAPFNVGTTNIVWTIMDVNGNGKQVTQQITVKDMQAPTVVAPDMISVVNTPGTCTATIASLGTPYVADNCGIASITNNAPAVFPVGTTVVTWTVTDIHGNTTDTAQQLVTVIDNQLPTATVQNITVSAATGQCNAIVPINTPVASDNCGIASINGVRNDGQPITAPFNVGTTVITWTIADVHGNGKQVQQQVTVTDNQLPAIQTPGNINLCKTSNNQYTIAAIGSNDNCGVASISYTITGATQRSGNGAQISGLFNEGVSTVKVMATDIHGNNAQISFTVTVASLPAVQISASSADLFCNKTVLTASGNNLSYEWLFNNTVVGTGQQLQLGLTNPDGAYTVRAINAAGCNSSTSTAYLYQKQQRSSSYTILAYDEVSLEENNTVASGSVGVIDRKGKASFRSNSSVAAPGAFVKAASIERKGSNINIPTLVYAAADVTLPTMQWNTSSTRNLPSYTVARNSTMTLSGNYKDLTIREGANVTLAGQIFGTINIEKGAQVRFTSAVVNIADLKVAEGSSQQYNRIRFINDAQIRVSNKVDIANRVWINPDQYKVTFFMGDQNKDDEKFVVRGNDVKVTANVYMPLGKLKVQADEANSKKNTTVTYINMTGLFIAQKVESKGDYVLWNNFSCDQPSSIIPTQTAPTAAGKLVVEAQENSVAGLTVVVMPNPSRSFFTLKLSSASNAPVQIRIADASGRIMETKANQQANSTVTVGHKLIPGTYFAELIQGNERKVVQLIRIQ